MIEVFRERFRQCLMEYRQELSGNALLLSLMDSLYALADKKVYDGWQMLSDMRYHGVTTLIACMQKMEGRATLLSLAEDLIKEGYETQAAPEFDEETLLSQMNLIEAITEGRAATLMAVMKQEE